MTRRKDWHIFIYGLLIAAAMLFFTTRSSPAWPINDWCDANIYLSTGKGMVQGRVLYRDLYDHKGPLLYALHALCALISCDSFLGVYLMEVLLAAVFLFFGYKAMTVYGSRNAALLLLPVLAWSVYAAWSFCEGDSAEEMCMPLVAASIWHVLAFLKSDQDRMSAKGLMAEGALAGCVLWIKFTGLGMQAGLLFAMFVRHLVKKEWGNGLRMIGWLIAGFVLSTLPWILYFGMNGAIGDWLGVYFYDNLFRYGGAGMTLLQRIKAMVFNGLGWLWKNWPYTLAILGGLNIYNMIVARVYFQTSIPGELYEAAKIDGASEFRTFFSVMLPLAKPIIAVITLYYAVWRWNDYFNALIYTSKQAYQPLQMVLRGILLMNENMTELMAGSDDAESIMDMARLAHLAQTMKYALIFIASAPMLIIYPFVQKHFVKGVMIGSLKG